MSKNKKLDFSAIHNALKSLKNAIEPPPLNDRERDGAIQRFEYTFELAWKTAKKVLHLNGIESQSPKTVIRDLLQQGWITDGEMWMAFLDARNESTHTYEEKTAQEVFEKSKAFLPECEKLIQRLVKEVK
ncbi:MAG: nucleotidyltransferase substrate binding protein [Bdellovibrio sp.]|nr:nucleotidyltransferase substrate binding protein [Bdellovibrio sp.]